MPENTVRHHRVLKTSPEKIYKAYLDVSAICKWFPPHGFTANVQLLEPKVGGSYKMSFTNFSTGKIHSFGGTYLELIPNEKLVISDQFDDPNLPGIMKTTVTLKKIFCGTEVNIVQEGIPESIPVEACYLGWQESLTLLAQLVEADVPD
jgi:uncharacterized protein YndB with AHSA1/START domain